MESLSSPEAFDFNTDHMRVLEEMAWEALLLDIEYGVRTQSEVDQAFTYWFGHHHNELPDD